MKKIRKCIIAAAWYGTRILPASKATPKEMLTLVDKPVIQYLVDEAITAGIEEIVIVLSRGKDVIVDHFDRSFELEQILEKKWKLKELDIVRSIGSWVKIAFVRQPEANGDGNALLCARPFVGDEPCLVLFGDDLIVGQETWAEELINAYEQYESPVILSQVVPDDAVSLYGIVDTVDDRVTQFLEKPHKDETSSRLAVIGKYIITPAMWRYIELSSVWKDGEKRLADGFIRAVASGEHVYAIPTKGQRYDTGSKMGYLQAIVDFALARPDLWPAIDTWLRQKYGK